MINSYVAFDLETTGLNPSTDKIIEIGAVKVIEGVIQATYSRLVNPEVPISSKVSALTGISSEMILGKPVINEVIQEFIDFTDELPVLGHNILFDYSFIKKAAVNNRLTFEKDGIDTLKMARRILPYLENRKLEYLCNYFNIKPEHSHRALDDSLSAIGVYLKLFELCPEDKGFTEMLKLNYSAKRDTSITPAQTTYLSKLILYHNIVMQAEIKTLTKSQASRLIDNIISEYGKIIC